MTPKLQFTDYQVVSKQVAGSAVDTLVVYLEQYIKDGVPQLVVVASSGIEEFPVKDAPLEPVYDPSGELYIGELVESMKELVKSGVQTLSHENLRIACNNAVLVALLDGAERKSV